MTEETEPNESGDLLAIYDRALPEVYGYLLHRCGDTVLAEDLTSETFLAAARAVAGRTASGVTVAWLMTVARNKLVDHWRRRSREERGFLLLGGRQEQLDIGEDVEDGPAMETLRSLPAEYAAVLVLRYVDGLSVPQVAAQLGKSVHATESQLARARASFRRAYREARDG